MHPLEYGNAADSSKILLFALPGSRLFVHGVRAHEEDFLQFIKDGNSALLYPGDSAQHVSYLLSIQKKTKGAQEEAHEDLANTDEAKTPASPFIMLVVLDGTWRQTRTIAKWLRSKAPMLPQVCLNEEDLQRHSALTEAAFTRPRTCPNRLSTTEAVAAVLAALGEEGQTIVQLVDMVARNSAALRAGAVPDTGATDDKKVIKR